MKKILQSIYSVIPFKSKIFELLKNIHVPSKFVSQHLHFIGDFKVEISKGLSFKMWSDGNQIVNELFWYGLYGGWEKKSQELWVKLSQNADVIVDIGANHGLYSLASKTINKNATVYAIEPLEFILKTLNYNIKLNNLDIKVLPYAFSNYNGEAIMYVPINATFVRSATVNTNLLERTKDKTQEIKIETKTLKNFIESNNLKKIDLIKIDVESHEPAVLEGMGDYLRLYKPTFLIEVSYEGVGDKLNKIFEGLGYLYYNIDENKGLRLEEKLSYSDSDNYLICQPFIAKQLGLLQ